MSAVSFPIAALFGWGGGELVLILLIVLLLFGGSKLPQLAKGLGESIREFKKASKDDPDEKKSDDKKSDGHGKN
jgi:sec-independent protein translocase protein TatA